jgi:hypothetical protein
MMPLPSKDIISALTNEVSIASIRTDINRSHWQDIYDDNEILREYTPSRIRISELRVSIPLAIDEIPNEKIVRPNITQKQLMRLLPSRISVEERINYASYIREVLLDKNLHLLSRNINEEIIKAISAVAPKIKAENLNIAYLDKLKRSYMSQPNEEREARFIYSAKELEKISSEHIIRIELSVNID